MESKVVKEKAFGLGSLCAHIIVFCVMTCAVAATAKFVMWLFM